jgi:hypothetical protein
MFTSFPMLIEQQSAVAMASTSKVRLSSDHGKRILDETVSDSGSRLIQMTILV